LIGPDEYAVLALARVKLLVDKATCKGGAEVPGGKGGVGGGGVSHTKTPPPDPLIPGE
jgi:hypothetical protein